MDAYTPDGRPICAPLAGLANLYLVGGGSGGGVKVAPALARHFTRLLGNEGIAS